MSASPEAPIPLAGMAGFKRNQWQPSTGIGGRFRPESVATFARNTHLETMTCCIASFLSACCTALTPPLSRTMSPCGESDTVVERREGKNIPVEQCKGYATQQHS